MKSVKSIWRTIVVVRIIIIIIIISRLPIIMLKAMMMPGILKMMRRTFSMKKMMIWTLEQELPLFPLKKQQQQL